MSWEKHLSQYQQIGNAVPPLLARAIAKNIEKYFEKLEDIQDDGRAHSSIQLSLFNEQKSTVNQQAPALVSEACSGSRAGDV